MKSCQLITPLIKCTLLIFFLISALNPSLANADISVSKQFTPGIGETIGYIVKVQGSVVLMHAEKSKTFQAAADIPLFQGDTLKTLKDGLVSFLLNDGSQLTLASETTIVINQSIYDPPKKERSSFIDMGLGKVRCWINKLSGFNRSEFKVKTKTAILGVRGSDFIIISKPRVTEVFTLLNTRLEVLGIAAPDVDPLVLSDFEKTFIGLGDLPADIESVPRFEADMLQRELPLVKQGPQVEKSFDEIQKEMMNTGIRVPRGNLVPPPPVGDIRASVDSRRPEIMRPRMPLRPMEQENLILDREAAKREEGNVNVSGEAPYFPAAPDTFSTGNDQAE